ncbi:MAG: M28 family peptidase [Bacteroidales bacterium]
MRNISCLLLLFVSLGLFAQKADEGRLEKMVTDLASDAYLGRGFGSEGGRLAAAYIKDQFKEAGIDPLLESYFHSFDYRKGILNITGYNIAAIIPGSDPVLKDEYIILGAHYDHLGWELRDGDTVVYNGADDNASGVAAIIEAGRILAERPDLLGRSVILVAFDGEESGLIGSKAFVSELITGEGAVIDSASVAAMFSLDMVGMYEAHEGVDLLGMEMLTDHKQLIADATTYMPVDIVKMNGSLANRTDTAPFGKIGVPAVHVYTGTESPYHKPEDESDLLDYAGMALIVNFMASLTRELSTVPEVRVSKQMEVVADPGRMKIFNPGIQLNTGSAYHDYKNDFYKAKALFAYGAGVFLETRITQWLALQPEVLYEWSGSRVSGGRLRTHSVTAPVSLLFTTPDEQGNGVRFYSQIGGYYSYAFGGNIHNDDGTSVPVDYISDYSDTDYGLVFGFGMEIMNFRMGYVWQRSLVDFTADQTHDVRHAGSFFRLGWAF